MTSRQKPEWPKRHCYTNACLTDKKFPQYTYCENKKKHNYVFKLRRKTISVKLLPLPLSPMPHKTWKCSQVPSIKHMKSLIRLNVDTQKHSSLHYYYILTSWQHDGSLRPAFKYLQSTNSKHTSCGIFDELNSASELLMMINSISINRLSLLQKHDNPSILVQPARTT